MSNKTISINPDIFNFGKRKTKKKEPTTSKTTVAPLISPNVLKNRLLKRIQEHKRHEQTVLKDNTDISKFTDEFTDSLNYLQSLNTQKKLTEFNKPENVQKRKLELERQTVKNYNSLYSKNNINTHNVNLELPVELEQPRIQSNIILKHPIDDIPYGNLKGGTKSTYKEWSKTQRNIQQQPDHITLGNPQSSDHLAREQRLNILKQKIQNKNTDMKLKEEIANSQQIVIPLDNNETIKNDVNNETIKNDVNVPQISELTIKYENNDTNNMRLIGTKHITKKTIKRKYTLGKSNIKKTIGVLLKDNKTRKLIINAQKELKQKNINEIKTYLRQHNLIKIGTNAPNDVLRKIYETAILSGDISNTNTDTLLYNFTKSTN